MIRILQTFGFCFWGAILCHGLPTSVVGQGVEVVVGLRDENPGKASPAELNAPFAVEFTAAGEMIIVEYDGGRLLSWTVDDGLRLIAGSQELGYQDGAGAEVKFNKLHNVAIDDQGRMYLSDHLNHAVRLYDPRTNLVSTFAGNGSAGFDGEQGDIKQARFRQAICVSLTPERDRLLVADIGNRRIREIVLQTGKVQTVAGNGQQGNPVDGASAVASPLQDPRAAAVAPDGSWYLLERNGNVLRHVVNGEITTVAGTGKKGSADGPALEAQFNGPKHMDIAPDGRVFIADDNNDLVRVYDPARQVVSTVSTAPYRLSRPHGVKVHEGQLYIADSYHHRVLKLPVPEPK